MQERLRRQWFELVQEFAETWICAAGFDLQCAYQWALQGEEAEGLEESDEGVRRVRLRAGCGYLYYCHDVLFRCQLFQEGL